jgi:uncharacterized protein (TIGR02118 family)
MVKVVALLPRRAEMSRPEFEQYLRGTHLPLVASMPGLRRLAINWVVPDSNGPTPEFDAVAEDVFDDVQAVQAAFASEEGKAVADDAPNFLDMSRFQLMITESEDIPPS